MKHALSLLRNMNIELIAKLLAQLSVIEFKEANLIGEINDLSIWVDLVEYTKFGLKHNL